MTLRTRNPPLSLATIYPRSDNSDSARKKEEEEAVASFLQQTFKIVPSSVSQITPEYHRPTDKAPPTTPPVPGLSRQRLLRAISTVGSSGDQSMHRYGILMEMAKPIRAFCCRRLYVCVVFCPQVAAAAAPLGSGDGRWT